MSFTFIIISKYQKLLDPPQDPVICCVNKEALWQPGGSPKTKFCYAAFADSHGVNTPTTANFKDGYL